MSKILEGLDKAVDQKIQNIISQNPKGSAAEQILLGKFLNSDQGAYARNVLGKNHKGWIEHITSWLKKYQPRLEKEFNELDFSDLTSLAYDMYENYLAKQGQLEEASKAEIRANLDQDIKDFLSKGGEIEKLKPNKVRAIPGMGLASKHIGTAGEINRKTRSKMLVGKGRNVHGTKPVVNVEEGEVVSLQARKTPLVVAGSPYDWDIYDLRTNKMVANILGGDRHESPLYEIRIRSSGMTPTTRMKPTYVLRAGRDNNPPYYAYELVAPEGGFGKVEKSPGPGGTTKLRPDQDDILRHVFKTLGGGKYYGYDLNMVEEGLDQYELIEKALGAKIMEVDDAMELGYTDWDPEDSSSIIYLGNQKNEGYSAGATGGAGLGEEVDEGIKSSIAAGILSGMGLLGSAQGQSADLSNFSTSYLQQVVSGEHPRPMVNKDDAKIELQKREQGTSTPSQPSVSKSTSGGFSTEYLKSVVDGTHPRPMISVEKAKEILQQRGVQEHINTPGGMGQSYRKFKPKEAGLNELKCWSGYTRVKGVPAGAPGSCKKKTKESSIMKGIQNEYDVDSTRKIEFSKENPPSLDYLYQQFIHNMLSSTNKVEPKDWINAVNNRYGLGYTWKDYQIRGHKDHTNNWDKIVNKYVLGKK